MPVVDGLPEPDPPPTGEPNFSPLIKQVTTITNYLCPFSHLLLSSPPVGLAYTYWRSGLAYCCVLN